jgi:mRNA interferase MazF
MMRGEVYIATIEPRSGSEQRGKRPVIVVSSNAFNRVSGWRSVIVVPVTTSRAQAKRGPTGILLPAGSAGLSKDSTALCHQVTTLDRRKLHKKIGKLGAKQRGELDDGLKAALDILV